MNNTKLSFLAAFVLSAFSAIQCTKKADEGFKVQGHDQNVFMTIMHSSMDSMMSMPMTMDPDHDFARMMKDRKSVV